MVASKQWESSQNGYILTMASADYHNGIFIELYWKNNLEIAT